MNDFFGSPVAAGAMEAQQPRINIPTWNPPDLGPPRDPVWHHMGDMRSQLKWEWYRSIPFNQYKTQVDRKIESLRWHNEWGAFHFEEARNTVTQRWKDQGIWEDHWPHPLPRVRGCLRWRHEDLTVRPDLEIGLFPEDPVDSRIQLTTEPPQPNQDLTRPLAQFLYQVEKNYRESTVQDTIRGSQAYEEVKSAWQEDGIWNRAWGTLPGHKWKHEEPFEFVFRAEMDAIFGEHVWEPYDKGPEPEAESEADQQPSDPDDIQADRGPPRWKTPKLSLPPRGRTRAGEDSIRRLRDIFRRLKEQGT